MTNENFQIEDAADAGFTGRPTVADAMGLQGAFEVTCYGPDGEEKWSESFENLVVDVGLDYALGASLGGATQSTTWYVGLVDGATPPSFSTGDTISSHGGWSEETAYDETNRVTWDSNSVSAQSIANSGLPASFNYSTSSDVAGAFLVDAYTKGGTAGTLFAEGSFSSTRSVGNGDTLDVTYTINAS